MISNIFAVSPFHANIKEYLKKKKKISQQGNGNHMWYLLFHFFPLFLAFLELFGVKMNAHPLLSSTCLIAACFDHKSQVSSLKVAWIFNDNVLSNNLNTGSFNWGKWMSGTNKSSSLTTAKIKGCREEKTTHPQPQF